MECLQDSHGLLRSLRVYKLGFRLRTLTDIKLPAYKGSTFKGVFGHQLKRIFCTNKNASNCRECLVFEKCPYVFLYEAPLPRGSQILGGTLAKSEFGDPALVEKLLENKIIHNNKNNPERIRFDAVIMDENQLNARLV